MPSVPSGIPPVTQANDGDLTARANLELLLIKCRIVCSSLPGERADYAARGVLRAFLTLWVGESGTMYRRFAH